MPEKASQESCIEIPDTPTLADQPWSMQKVWGLMKCFGPAAILASMSIGAGETIVVVRTGAWAGYDLLWVVLLACLVKGGFITYMLGRYTVISGEFIGHRLVKFPGPRGWLLIMIVAIEMIFAPLAWVAIAKPCGNLVGHLISGPAASPEMQNLYTTLFILAALCISLTLTYERLEREQLIVCGILVAGTMIGTLMVWPSLWSCIEGTFLRFGQFPKIPKWAPPDVAEYRWLNLATVFAYVGGSVAGYVVYANWVGMRGWGLAGHPDIDKIRERASKSSKVDYLPEDPEQRNRLFKSATPLYWDVILGATVLFVVTAAFMVAGAALYDQETEFKGWSLLTDQAGIWNNIHPGLVPVYYVTVMAAMLGTLTALPEVYARVTHEFSQAIWPENKWKFGHIRVVIAVLIFSIATPVIWSSVNFDLLIQVAGFFLSNFAVAAAAIAAFYLNHKLPPAYRVNKIVFAGAVLSTTILVLASSMSGWGLLKKLMAAFSG